MEKQLHIFYSGRVQGIGFRYTVLEIASQEKVSGWVKNLKDSRVEVIIEGNQVSLDNFLKQVSSKFSNYIEDTAIEELPTGSKFKDFKIKFE
ncbi:MAG: acylphosphatase [Candidatus Omnitrophica bacterium]|jgi:acylphosphatase|nr:acylphosphatase [Candidatus Omnitrophota bacterium]